MGRARRQRTHYDLTLNELGAAAHPPGERGRWPHDLFPLLIPAKNGRLPRDQWRKTSNQGGIMNFGGGCYLYNWKTSKNDTGCKLVTMSLPCAYRTATNPIATFKFFKK
jgi:hypothetical protein